MRRFGQVRVTRWQAGNGTFGKEAGLTLKRRLATGFTLLELLVVLTIGLVLTTVAVPMTLNAVRSYTLTSAVATATGAIQSTRYAAIMHGYPYEITFTQATNSYQVYSEPGGQTTYSAVGAPIPITGSGGISISRTVTYQFLAGGTVTETSTPPNAGEYMIFSITNDWGGSNTITVSGVGNVSVSRP